jgi:hypothetical protein
VGAVVSLIHIKHRHIQNTLFLLSNVFWGWDYRLVEGFAFGVKLYIKCFFFVLVLDGMMGMQDCQEVGGEDCLTNFFE